MCSSDLLLVADLRRAFSGIVAGNVKPETIKAVREHGRFEIRGEKEIMGAMDAMLTSSERSAGY